MPLAAHIRGYIEIVVNPGIVLISLITGSVLGEEEVDAGQALAVDGMECADRQLAHLLCDAVVDLGGHVELRGIFEVLRSEVVERVLATADSGHPDLTDRAGFDPAVGEFQYAALDFAAEHRRFDDHLRIVAAGQLDRRGQLIPGRHPADPDRRAAAGGLDEHRQPESFAVLERQASACCGRSTTWSPMGSPSAANSFLVNSLSMPAALASTPAPTYGTPASSSRPWMVPSSPYGPCSTGNTTSTAARTSGRAVAQRQQFAAAPRVGGEGQCGARCAADLRQPTVG